jgi:hypothetical protein
MVLNKFRIEFDNISSSKITSVINDFNEFYKKSLKLVKELNGININNEVYIEYQIINPNTIEITSSIDKEHLIIFFNFGIYLGYFIYVMDNDISVGIISDHKNITIHKECSIFIQIGLPEALFNISKSIKLEYNLSIKVIGNYEVPVCEINGNLSPELLFYLGYQLPFEEGRLGHI